MATKTYIDLNFHDIFLKSVQAPINFRYGYPKYGLYEPDVMFQFIFNIGSGNLVDQVAGHELDVVGTPAFNQLVSSGRYINISPGIYYTSGNYHERELEEEEVWTNPTTGQMTIEYVFRDEELGSGTERIMLRLVNDDASDEIYISHRCDTPQKYIELRIVTNTLDDVFSFDTSLSDIDIRDGNSHKVRITIDDEGDVVLSIGTTTFAGIPYTLDPLESLEFTKFTIGAYTGGTFPARSSIFELRFNGNLTNDSGGTGPGSVP